MLLLTFLAFLSALGAAPARAADGVPRRGEEGAEQGAVAAGSAQRLRHFNMAEPHPIAARWTAFGRGRESASFPAIEDPRSPPPDNVHPIEARAPEAALEAAPEDAPEAAPRLNVPPSRTSGRRSTVFCRRTRTGRLARQVRRHARNRSRTPRTHTPKHRRRCTTFHHRGASSSIRNPQLIRR